MRITILSVAERAIESIGDYIARDNPARAITFVDELRQAFEVLASFPEAFPRVTGFEQNNIRFHTHGRYVIYFRVFPAEDRVTVLRVLHGSQDYRHNLL